MVGQGYRCLGLSPMQICEAIIVEWAVLDRMVHVHIAPSFLPNDNVRWVGGFQTVPVPRIRQ